MSVKIERKLHKIDATGQSLGRMATMAAKLLIGKHKPSYTPHIDNGDFVTVENIDKAGFTGKKLEQKLMHRFSGYPGGLTTEKLGDVFYKKPGVIFKGIVKKMLPKNKLQARRIKRLTIK